MKDLIEKILAYLPQYLTDFGLLFSGPKRFIAQRNTKAEDAFDQSLLFLGISLVLAVIMQAPLLPEGTNLWSHLGTIAVMSLLSVSLAAIALRLAWRIVGGRATMRSFFVTYAYSFGVLYLVLVVFWLLAEGVFKVFDPELYGQIVQARLRKQPWPDLSDSVLSMVWFGILLAGWVFASAWGFVAWGAYRELNGLSKGRSFLALLIAGAFSLPLAVLVFFVAAAMTPT